MAPVRARDVELVTATDVLISGGGTGGHVFPALALAEELVARGHDRDRIRFVGAARGLEATAVPAAGFEIDLLPGRGLERSASPAAIGRNLRTTYDTVVAFARASALVGRLRPRVVVGVGGYASLPALVAARARRIPAVVHESDAHPGLANRIAVRLGATAAVTLPDTPLRGAVVTGNPIRPAIAKVQRDPVAPPQIAVVGGSLGARSLNEAVLGLYDRWRDRTDLTIHHVTGSRDYQGCSTKLAAERGAGDRLSYQLVPFEEHMEVVYTEATLVVSRSGGMTAELTTVGMPSVLVPLPGAPGDHQTANADALVAAGAAVKIPDAELDPARLAAELDALLGDPARLATMGAAALALGRPDATARFADLVEASSGR
ncbi:MAG TPA: UDP-N-acetylglucosamine--N-acetylmuramyl-(pentapeptide) pyrophosphoryl-undecaprenol N-acetylglucosamine transferase [Acidimicrobiia bacterium]